MLVVESSRQQAKSGQSVRSKAVTQCEGLTNERDFPVPSEPRPVKVAVYGTAVPRWRGESFHQRTCLVEGEIITIVTVGIDPAKNVFAVHGGDSRFGGS